MKVFGVTGRKDAGKTTLVEALVRELTARGLVVATLKHAHHGFEVDEPGRDSFRHREAGAREVLVASGARWALMHEGPAPGLFELLGRLSPCDLALVEGWKGEPHPKLEVWRAALGEPPLAVAGGAANVVAVASDDPVEGLRRVALSDVPALADLALAEAA
ncbi:MAG TPA: molybdopterin-guanine dinucleotide biosynthesis protein B [Paracoccaceae bacterium]|nr:molybdopterin-guanine dinucleotide biosynthesis protein B [Paracoccaceae bacterium]